MGIDNLADLVNDILKHRESIFSLWGEKDDKRSIFLGLFPDEETAKIASDSVISSICTRHIALKHEKEKE